MPCRCEPLDNAALLDAIAQGLREASGASLAAYEVVEHFAHGADVKG